MQPDILSPLFNSKHMDWFSRTTSLEQIVECRALDEMYMFAGHNESVQEMEFLCRQGTVLISGSTYYNLIKLIKQK